VVLALILLVASACGAIGADSTIPTHVPVPITPPHGLLYAFAAADAVTSGGFNTDVHAVNLSDGTPVWQTQVSGRGVAALGGGTLYLGPYEGETGTLQAWNANTGAPLWRVTSPSGYELPVAATSDTMFVEAVTEPIKYGPPEIMLTALHARDGTPMWTVDLGLQPSEPAATTLGDGTLYLATTTLRGAGTPGPSQPGLTAVDTGSGKILWHTLLSGTAEAPLAPVLSDGVLYMAASDSSGQFGRAVLAVRASDGMLLWSKAAPAATEITGFVVTGGMVCYSYGGTNVPGGIVVLHASDGSLSWQSSTPGTSAFAGVSAAITADGSKLYALEPTSIASTAMTRLHVFDVSTGKSLLLQSFPRLPIQVTFGWSAPLQVVSGVLYVVGTRLSTNSAATGVSIAVALNTYDASLVWQHQFNGIAQPNFLVAPQSANP
jgi:outer membrane protein assembly factor BamB